MKHFAFALATRRRTSSHVALLIVCSVVALVSASSGRAVAHIDGVKAHQLPNFDARESVAPSKAQLAAAHALGARVSWNQFGVAGSVIRYGGYLATGLKAPDAAAAARTWLGANKVLFKLSSTDVLAVETARPLVGHDRRLRSRLPTAANGVESTDGFVTVSVVGSAAAGWKVVYASSSLTGGTVATGSYRPATGGGLDRSRQPCRGPRLDRRRLRSGDTERHDDARRRRLLGAAEGGEGRLRDAASRRPRGVQDQRSSRRRATAFSPATTSSSTRRPAGSLYRQNVVDNALGQPDVARRSRSRPRRRRSTSSRGTTRIRTTARALVLDGAIAIASSPRRTPASSIRSASPPSGRGTSTRTR